jgi:hypothetical protein
MAEEAKTYENEETSQVDSADRRQQKFEELQCGEFMRLSTDSFMKQVL